MRDRGDAHQHRSAEGRDRAYGRPAVADRLNGPAATRDYRARAVAAAALACMDAAVEEWTASTGGKLLDALLDTAIPAVRE